MFGFSFLEIVLVLVVFIIFVKPKDIPNAIHKIAFFIGKMRRAMQDARDMLDEVKDLAKPEPKVKDYLARKSGEPPPKSVLDMVREKQDTSKNAAEVTAEAADVTQEETDTSEKENNQLANDNIKNNAKEEEEEEEIGPISNTNYDIKKPIKTENDTPDSEAPETAKEN